MTVTPAAPRIGFVNVGGGNSISSLTVRVFVTDVANPVVLAFVTTTTSSTISSITLNGNAMTLVDAASNGSAGTGRRLSLYKYIGPSTGAQDCVVNGSSNSFVMTVIVIYNVDQSVSLGTSNKTNGSGVASSIAIASSPGDLVISGLANRGGEASVGSGQYELTDIFSGVPLNAVNFNDASRTGTTTTLSWSWGSSDNYAQVGVAVKPAVALIAPRAAALGGI